MKKIFLIPLIILAVGLVVATVYYFVTIGTSFNVLEPLNVLYYFGDETCSNTWENNRTLYTNVSEGIIFGDVFAGATIKICFGVLNKAPSVIPFTTTLEGDDWDTMVEWSSIQMPSYVPAYNNTLVREGEADGYVEFKMNPDAIGSFTGQIMLGKGKLMVMLNLK